MKVLKFGGTSVATPENIRKVKAIAENSAQSESIVVVVSAFGGVTNKLIECCSLAEKGDPASREMFREIEQRHLDAVRDLIPVKEQSSVLAQVVIMLNELENMLQGILLVKELSLRTKDFVMSFGERLSSFIISRHFQFENLDCQLLDCRDLIKTDSHFGKAEVDFGQTNALIQKTVDGSRKVYLAPGFLAADQNGTTTTLGRGGSDYTAAIFAAAIDANVLEIWTDVEGMMTADPRKVPQAFPVPEITYKETMELSHFGAKVIYPPTIRPVYTKHIPILIKNTFKPEEPGTLIRNEADPGEHPVRGLSTIAKIALMSINGPGLVGIPGVAKRLFSALSMESINVILITQASSEHAITFAILPEDVEAAKKAIQLEFEYELALNRVEEVEVETGLSILAMVGDNMSNQVGIAGKMFSTLGSNGVNIRAIAQGSSERNISAVIQEKDLEKAMNALHESFFLSSVHTLHLFIAGTGNVGRTLLEMIYDQQETLEKEHNLRLRIVGLSNSRKMLINTNGIDINDWESILSKEGKIVEAGSFSETIRGLNLANSIFVDCTASAIVSEMYRDLLASSISVVTANKIACASDFAKYADLKATAKKYTAQFLYETNVGAGLPVISTLKDLVRSGDKVHRIEAVLSGTLNFVTNNYLPGTTFHDVVQAAQEAGFTEPDPRLDLNGMDVMRKILILARESGAQMEPGDIEVRQFVPEKCFEADDVPAFYETLKVVEEHFAGIRDKAHDAGKKLRFVAKFNNGSAEAGLEEVSQDHPFYNLEGKDNIVLFYTERYSDQPLVVKGAGAGAAVTASGVFADLMRLGNA